VTTGKRYAMPYLRLTLQFLPLLLLLALPTAAADQATALSWDHREAVRYQENHDPSMIWLTDGRQLQVHYASPSWGEVEKWTKGRPLTILYTAAGGFQLVDDATGKRLRVLSGMEHPLDKLLDRNLEKEGSTIGMSACYSQATRQWQMEMDRTLEELREALPPKESQAVKAAQDAWVKFRDAERKAINAIHSREGTGTISITEAASAHLGVIRDRTLTLRSRLATVW
jgi:uncharacterized protein YecT (DUF1311 family)